LKKFLILTSFVFYYCASIAQTNNKIIVVNYEVNTTADTVSLSITKNIAKKGTLLVVVTIDELNLSDSLYYPLLDTINYFDLIIPAFYKDNDIKLQALFYPSIFTQKGKVLSKLKDDYINAVLLTDNKRFYTTQIELANNNEFELPKLVFENKATLVFNYNNAKRKAHPNIAISYSPQPNEFVDTVFIETLKLNNKAQVPTAATFKVDTVNTTSKYKKKDLLNEVVVKTKVKSKAEKYNAENSTGMFKEIMERVIDCLDNDDILSYSDCLAYISTRMAGIRLNNSNGEPNLIWRNKEVKAFFIDEIPVDIEQILSFSVNDIAIIKVFPPPFSGSSNGDGGGIAIYSRKGEYRRVGMYENKWIFSIKGYTNAQHILFTKMK
jgi:hypothetical protein